MRISGLACPLEWVLRMQAETEDIEQKNFISYPHTLNLRVEVI